MAHPLSPRAREILTEIEAEAQRRRPPLREVSPSAEPRRAAAAIVARRAAPTVPPAAVAPDDLSGVLELVDAVASECRLVQRRLAHVADALDEVAEHLQGARPAQTTEGRG